MTDEALEELRRLFEVMERLRAPGGCPWDRAQSHRSLLPFLLEETYEAIEAAERDDQQALAEELGDLLVEVAMHSAIAAEGGSFDIGEVARRATEKMVGRHPHVFAELEVSGVDQVLSNWEELKAREKPSRRSRLDGIPKTLPSLSLAAAIQRRQPPEAPACAGSAQELLGRLLSSGADADSLAALVGELLFEVVALARARGVDAEAALRQYGGAQRARWRERELARGESAKGTVGEAPESK